MTERTTPIVYPLSATLLVVALAAFNWLLDPADAVKWMIAGLVLPLGWGGYEIFLKDGPGLQRVRGSAMLAATLLGVVLAFSAADAAEIFGAGGTEISRRAFGVMMGIVLIVIGNVMPKQLEPLMENAVGAAKAQAMRRFAGWTFVLAGAAHAASWLILPTGLANIVGMSIVAGALLLLIARWGFITDGKQ